MRLVKSNIDRKTMAGTATLTPEEPEDMWHAYNLIRENDIIRAGAVRKVITENASSRSSERVHMTLTIKVTKLDFDPQAGQLHVSGQVKEENKYVKLGSYHTLDLELHRNFTIEKADGWDSVALDTLKEAIDETKKAQLWAVTMQPGLANIWLITEHQTIFRQRVEVSMPSKGDSGFAKAQERFHKTLFDTLLRQLDLSEPLPLLIASSAFLASNFQKYIKTQAANGTNKQLRNLLPKIMVAPSSNADLSSLREVLSSPGVTKQLGDTKFARETQLLERFLEMTRQDDTRAWYGPKECIRAVEQGAVGKGGGVLMISDKLFRSQDIATRKKWVQVVDDVKEQGGEVRVLSSVHESGKRLEGLGDIAVILTYPIDDLGEDDGYGDVNGGHDLPDEGEVGASNGVEGARPEYGADNIDLFD